MSGCPSTRPLLVGVGNAYRGDDAAGLLVAREVAANWPASAAIVESDGETAALMALWRGLKRVIVADAVSTDAAAGTILRIEAEREQVQKSLFRFSSHGFGVAEAIELSRALGELPDRLLLIGIVVADVRSGARVSPAVEQAVRAAARSIAAELPADGGGE